MSPDPSRASRVLHVVWGSESESATPPVDAHVDEAALVACARFIKASPEHAHDVVIIGGSEAGRFASRAGLARHRRVLPGAFGGTRRRLLNGVEQASRPSVIVAWGTPVIAMADDSLWGVAPILGVDLRAGELVSSRGARSPLGTDLGAISPGQREAMRRSLGLEPDEVVVGLLDQPAGLGHCVGFLFIAGVLRVGGVRIVAMLDRRTRGFQTSLRHMREIRYVPRVVAVDGSIHTIAAAADVCIAGCRQDARHREATFGELMFAGIAAKSGTPTILPEGARTANAGYPAFLCSKTARPTEYAKHLLPLIGDASGRDEARRACMAWSMRQDSMAQQIAGAIAALCGAGVVR